MNKKTYLDFGPALEGLRPLNEDYYRGYQGKPLSYNSIGLGMSFNKKYGNKYHWSSWVRTQCKYPKGKIPKVKLMEEFADYFSVEPEYFYEYRLKKVLDFIDKNRWFLDKCLDKYMPKYKEMVKSQEKIKCIK